MGEICLFRGSKGCLLALSPLDDGRWSLRFGSGEAMIACTPAALELAMMGISVNLAGPGSMCSMSLRHSTLRFEIEGASGKRAYDIELARIEAALALLGAGRGGYATAR